MNTKTKSLFTNFIPVSKQEWVNKANIDLKGACFNKKLVWKNLNKIDIQPFYTNEDNQVFLKNTGKNSSTLINYRCIFVNSEKEGNKLALKAIDEGINGLLFDFKGEISASKLLEGIDLNKIAVSFNLNSNEVKFALDFFNLVKETKIAPSNLKGYFNLNIIQNYVTSGKIDLNQFSKVSNLIQLASDYPNYKSFSISGGVYLDAGANQVQEVAYTLNSLVYSIENLAVDEIDMQSIFNNLHFQLNIGSEYFIEIGKFRAFNNLLHEIAAKYGVYKFSHTLTAKTSIWTKSVTDANTNMLRATTEAMSAILGNADAVLIDSYDNEFNETSDFSSRISGNIATILKEESYFGKVSNPVDGSYYIEEVSSKIANNALELFKSVEENGGFYKSFEREFIQNQLREIRFKKIKLISQRKLAMVGVNKYPNLMETVSPSVFSNYQTEAKTNSKVLKPRRAALEIEALRKTTEKLVETINHRPIVSLTSFGNLAMRKARAAFSYDFMGVSGFTILQEQSYNSAKQAAEESAKSTATIVTICSSDQDYEESAVNFVKTFRAINKDKVLLLAGNPIYLLNELTEAGLDGCINMKSDVINTISSIQNKIQKTIKPIEA
jgi:methylmalonyl-CoA mutase